MHLCRLQGVWCAEATTAAALRRSRPLEMRRTTLKLRLMKPLSLLRPSRHVEPIH